MVRCPAGGNTAQRLADAIGAIEFGVLDFIIVLAILIALVVLN
jgi:hypothetical protein